MKRWQLRTCANWVNGSTPLGLAVARLGHCSVKPSERGMYVASGYVYGFPTSAAFTVGSVIITRHSPEWLEHRPRLLAHEERHAGQFAICGGLPLIPLYLVSMAYSKWRTGDRAAANVFERRAGLADGGYTPRPPIRTLFGRHPPPLSPARRDAKIRPVSPACRAGH